MDKRYKFFSKNLLLFAISAFGTKALAFLMVPLYTRVLSASEYGKIDILQASIQLCIPIFTLNIAMGVMRFSFEDIDKPVVFTVGMNNTITGTGILGVFLFGAHNFWPHVIPFEFCLIIISLVLLNAIYLLEVNFLRGIDKITTIVVASIIYSFTMLTSNIILLVYLKLGVSGFFVSMIMGYVFALMYIEVLEKIHRYYKWKCIKYNEINKKITLYCIPTIITDISWWINALSDRYMLTIFCGSAVNGIYSMAGKIPNILGMVQSVVGQAWTISAIKEYESVDREEFYGIMYTMYNFVLLVAAAMLLTGNSLLCKIFFANEFSEAWNFVPLLIIASIFSGLSGYIGNVFSAIKNTKILAKTTLVSAVFNVLLNILLIPTFGAAGAAAATAVSYLIAWIARVYALNQYIKIRVCWKSEIVSYLLLLCQAVLATLYKELYPIKILILIIILLLHKEQILFVFNKIKYFKPGRKSF